MQACNRTGTAPFLLTAVTREFPVSVWVPPQWTQNVPYTGKHIFFLLAKKNTHTHIHPPFGHTHNLEEGQRHSTRDPSGGPSARLRYSSSGHPRMCAYICIPSPVARGHTLSSSNPSPPPPLLPHQRSGRGNYVPEQFVSVLLWHSRTSL